jgi:2-keto-3-deoxy-L-rhamnonate aldolase RhmA
MLAFSTDQLKEPVERIKAACEEFGRVMGGHSLNATDALRWVGRGSRLVSLGADSVMLATIAAQELETARQGAGAAGAAGTASTPYG